MIDIRSIRVRDTPVGALVGCRRNDRRLRDLSLSPTRATAVTVFSSVLRELSLTPQRRAGGALEIFGGMLPEPLVRWLLENCRASTSIFSK